MNNSDDTTYTSSKAVIKARKKSRVTMYLDPAILESFRAEANHRGARYQSLINDTLRRSIDPDSAPVTVRTLRQVVREELVAHRGAVGFADQFETPES